MLVPTNYNSRLFLSFLITNYLLNCSAGVESVTTRVRKRKKRVKRRKERQCERVREVEAEEVGDFFLFEIHRWRIVRRRHFFSVFFVPSSSLRPNALRAPSFFLFEPTEGSLRHPRHAPRPPPRPNTAPENRAEKPEKAPSNKMGRSLVAKATSVRAQSSPIPPLPPQPQQRPAAAKAPLRMAPVALAVEGPGSGALAERERK